MIDQPNINIVYQMACDKAREKYSNDVIDVEVQMLSKLCKAVKDFDIAQWTKKL